MRIGIDARIAAYDRSGIHHYLTGLLDALARSRTTETYCIYQSRKSANPLVHADGFKTSVLYTPCHFRWEQITLPWEISCRNIDLLHYVDFFGPVLKRIPVIFSIHDLYFLKNPEVMSRDSLKHYKRMLPLLPQAAHIICDSQCSKDDLLAVAPVKAERVSVVYPGISEDFYAQNQESAVISHQSPALTGLPSDYFLFIGTLEPRKNLSRVLEGYKLAWQKLGDEIWPFVIAGRAGYRAQEVLTKISREKLEKKVIYLGPVSNRARHSLYQHAKALLYASLYEGFGLPLLEAMASSVPVITSNTSSMPEVAAEAALLADPGNTEEIAHQIMLMFSDEGLRRSLISKGLARAQDFSWDKAASEIQAIYQKIETK